MKEIEKPSPAVTELILNKLRGHALEGILEIGCGRGENLERLRPFFTRLYGVEENEILFPPTLGEEMRVGPEILSFSLKNIPFRPDSLDLVFTSGLLARVGLRQVKGLCAETVRISRRFVVCIESRAKLGAYGPTLGQFYLEYFPELELLECGACGSTVDWWIFRKNSTENPSL